jgi:anti-sigma B factor antagonist
VGESVVPLSDFHPKYLTIEERDDVVRVRFTDQHLTDEANIEEISRELFSIVDQFGKRKIILDLEGMKLITSSVLGKMITLHRRLHRLDGKLVICNAEDYVSEILKTSRLFDYFNVVADPAVAYNSFV